MSFAVVTTHTSTIVSVVTGYSTVRAICSQPVLRRPEYVNLRIAIWKLPPQDLVKFVNEKLAPVFGLLGRQQLL